MPILLPSEAWDHTYQMPVFWRYAARLHLRLAFKFLPDLTMSDAISAENSRDTNRYWHTPVRAVLRQPKGGNS